MKILMIVLSVFILSLPISMTGVKIDVPVWSLIVGHCGMFALGLIIAHMNWENK